MSHHNVDQNETSVSCPHCGYGFAVLLLQAGPCQCPNCKKQVNVDPAIEGREEVPIRRVVSYWPKGSGVTSRPAQPHRLTSGARTKDDAIQSAP